MIHCHNDITLPISQSKNCSVRLPKIELPAFHGDILKYYEFMEAFKNTVDSSDLTNVEKFTYLKQFLSGEALSTLEGLPITNDNYIVALELLRERYGDETRRTRAHIKCLLELDTCDFQNATYLRSFIDKVKLHMRGLEVLDLTSDKYDVFLCEILLSKVPSKYVVSGQDGMTKI